MRIPCAMAATRTTTASAQVQLRQLAHTNNMEAIEARRQQSSTAGPWPSSEFGPIDARTSSPPVFPKAQRFVL